MTPVLTRRYSFDNGTLACQQFYNREGHLVVPKDHVERIGVAADRSGGAEVQLERWLKARRKDRANGKLWPGQIKALDALGMEWDPREAAFQRVLAACRQFNEREGHLVVPTDHVEHIGMAADGSGGSDMNLGEWIPALRQDRSAGRLSDAQIATLDALGMAWSTREAAFQEGLAACAQYFKREGHLRVPQRHVERIGVAADGSGGTEVRLGSWINERRKQRAAGKLSNERIAALDALGMVWNVLEADFQIGLTACVQYRNREGNLAVHEDHVERVGVAADGSGGTEVCLGSWLGTRRYERRQGRLSRERIAALDALGIVWTASTKSDVGRGLGSPTPGSPHPPSYLEMATPGW